MKNITKVFSVYLFLLGLIAVNGGWTILTKPESIHLTTAILKNTPFTSFFIPGLILLFIVGGTQFLGAFMLWFRKQLQYEAAALAGFTLLIWTCTELYVLPSHQFIQVVYLAFAISILIAVMLLLKYLPVKR